MQIALLVREMRRECWTHLVVRASSRLGRASGADLGRGGTGLCFRRGADGLVYCSFQAWYRVLVRVGGRCRRWAITVAAVVALRSERDVPNAVESSLGILEQSGKTL